MQVIHAVITGIMILVVFYSIIIHELSHAVVSNWLGDDTAKRAGRISLNPLKHIDWFGTVLLPLLMYFTAGVIWGYAKPVPLNPYNYKNIKQGIGLSALAGPLSNILIAIVFALVYQLSSSGELLPYISANVVFFNLLLAFFNLIPIPPLDGSKVLGMLLPDDAYWRWMAHERMGMYVIFGVLIISRLMNLNILGKIIMPPIMLGMKLLGVPF